MQKQVLIVDDDLHVREELRLAFLLHGYEVLEASDGQEGVRLAREKKPKVILQDILIGKLDGLRVVRLLKFDERFKGTHMIAITQLGRQETQEEARRMGFDDFLVKPLDPEAVVAKVDEIYKNITQ